MDTPYIVSLKGQYQYRSDVEALYLVKEASQAIYGC